MLSYTDAVELLSSYGADAPWVRHCFAVSAVADRLAVLLSKRNDIDLDFRLLKVGALLHDIGRCRTQHPILHGVEGFRLLSSLGHDREAFICASHVLCGMGREEASRHGLPDQDFFPRTLEEQLVPLIDSVVELDRPTTLDERCASISRRYQQDPLFLARFQQAADTARSAMSRVSQQFGISLEIIAQEALNKA